MPKTYKIMPTLREEWYTRKSPSPYTRNTENGIQKVQPKEKEVTVTRDITKRERYIPEGKK